MDPKLNISYRTRGPSKSSWTPWNGALSRRPAREKPASTHRRLPIRTWAHGLRFRDWATHRPGPQIRLLQNPGQHTRKQANHGLASQKLDHQPATGDQPSDRDFVRTLDLAASNWPQKTTTTTPSLNPEQLWTSKAPVLQTLEELGFQWRSTTQSSSQRLACSGGELKHSLFTGLPIKAIRESRLVLNAPVDQKMLLGILYSRCTGILDSSILHQLHFIKIG